MLLKLPSAAFWGKPGSETSWEEVLGQDIWEDTLTVETAVCLFFFYLKVIVSESFFTIS